MLLAYIWFSFFLIAFLICIYQSLKTGDFSIFNTIMQGMFEHAKLATEISIGLIGIMALWLGFFKVAEQSGLIRFLSRGLNPLFRHLMPDLPPNHPATGAISMNMAANMLGIDNAATPFGLKAMRDLQSVNPNKQVASNPQILFLVLNTSSVTLLPITIFLYRAQQGAANPSDVFLPILLATSASTFVGLLTVSYFQRIKILHPVLLAYFFGIAILMSSLVYWLINLPNEQMMQWSANIGNLILFSIIVLFLVAGFIKKLDIFSAFIDGAKTGFSVAIRIIPYLVAMIVAIGVFRNSGAMAYLLSTIESVLTWANINTDFTPAIPTAIMKPLSGSGARAMLLETMNHYGVDSFPARIAAIIQGSTETTFYVLAVYFGSVGIKRARHALFCGLMADLAGILTAIFIGYWFFY